MTQAAILSSSASSGVSTGYKNRIINGAMNIWQRSTSATGAGYVAVDRFYSDNTTTFSRSTDVPNTSFKYSCSCAFSSSQYSVIAQRIESLNSYDLVGQSVTVSFWFKQTVGNTLFNLQLYGANATDNFGGGVTTLGNTTFSVTSGTWTYVTKTFTNLGSTAANGVQFYLYGNDPSAATTYLITGVQLEVGTTATNFEYRDYGNELRMCQRYYQLCNGFIGTPGATTTNMYTSIQYQTAMRTNPSLGQTGIITMSAPGVDVWAQSSTGIAAGGQNTTGTWIQLNNFSGLTNHRPYVQSVNYAGNGYVITLSAEL